MLKALTRVLAVPAIAGLATALAATTLTTSTPAMAGTGTIPCDDACQAAWEQQRANAVPRADFYDAPDPLPWAPAGTLIRREDATADYAVGYPVTRVMYHSRNSKGRDIAATGVVLVPEGRPPRGGWPVVVDAHGTSGVGRDCAPSLMRDLYHGDQMAKFLEQGYAVVAPDYAGLGTDGRNEAGSRIAAANDVLNGLRSARQAVGHMSGQWVLWGHSQGGAAALATAERQRHLPQPGYLGAVITSPASDLAALVKRAAEQPTLGGFVPLIASGARQTDPGIRLDQVFTPEALQRFDVLRTGCLGVLSAVYGDLSGPALVRPDYLSEPGFAKFLASNSTGNRPVAGPILLLQGEADVLVTRSMTDGVAKSLRDNGVDVDYRTYPGLGHDTYPGFVTGIDDGAMPDILAWIGTRFGDARHQASTP